MTFNELINQLRYCDERELYTATITANWLQGRTTFGGLTAALAQRAMMLTLDKPLPLRGMNVQFMGPVGEGEVTIAVDVLRQGKSVTFLQASVCQNGRVGAMVQAAFGAARPSEIHVAPSLLANVPSADQSFMLPKQVAGKPAFTAHFDMAWAVGSGPMSGSEDAKCGCWVRLDEPHDINEAYLIALADILPPAVIQMFKQPAPLSTVTWHMTPLVDVAQQVSEGVFKPGDWWYVELDALGSDSGYSQQIATIYHQSGVAVASSHQSIALFA